MKAITLTSSHTAYVFSCWQGTLGGNNEGNKRLAIKTLKASNSTSDSDAEDLDRELSILQHLRHPNVVRLAGTGQTPEVTHGQPTITWIQC